MEFIFFLVFMTMLHEVCLCIFVFLCVFEYIQDDS